VNPRPSRLIASVCAASLGLSSLGAGAMVGLAQTASTAPWTAGAPIPPDSAGGALSGRTEGACASMIGGKIYVADGFDPSPGADTTALRIYDPSSNTWALGPSSPGAGHSEFYEGVAHGGKLYCIGGVPDDPTLIFDTGTNKHVVAGDVHANHIRWLGGCDIRQQHLRLRRSFTTNSPVT
jgi:Kelch motif